MNVHVVGDAFALRKIAQHQTINLDRFAGDRVFRMFGFLTRWPQNSACGFRLFDHRKRGRQAPADRFLTDRFID